MQMSDTSKAEQKNNQDCCCKQSCLKIDKIQTQVLQAHKIKGFSDIEFDDRIVCHNGIINVEGAATEFWGPTLNLVAPNTSTSASAGSASALPSVPAGYLHLLIDNSTIKIPYYN
jgi:hypothetical protein